jgi:hypothetical protein
MMQCLKHQHANEEMGISTKEFWKEEEEVQITSKYMKTVHLPWL